MIGIALALLPVMARAEGTEPGGDRTVESFLNTRLRLGGFFETALTAIDGRDTDAQIGASENILGLNIAAEFNENARFVTQFLTGLSLPIQNIHNDPRASTDRGFQSYTTGTLVTQGYAEWSLSDGFNLQAGMGYTPYGITFQQLELVLFVRRGGPQLLRTTDLVYPLWQGVHAHGSFSVPSGRWGYHFYTTSPQSSSRMIGAGTRFWWRSAEDAVSAGVSTQSGRRNGSAYTTLGPDLRVRWNDLTVTTEISQSLNHGHKPLSFYVEPDYTVLEESVVLYVFADYLSDPLNATLVGATTIPDPIRKWEYGLGANWLPTSYTRLRLGLTLNDYVGANSNPSGIERDYWVADFSAGVAF